MSDSILLSQLENLRILLVDDDPFMLDVLAHTLRSIGFEHLHTAGNAQGALEYISAHPVDVLITDIRMPGTNGLELLRMIRCGDTQASQHLRVILISVLEDPLTMSIAMSLDANGFLNKPFKPIKVVRAILQALSEQESHLRDLEEYRDVDLRLEQFSQPENPPRPARRDEAPGTDRVKCEEVLVYLSELQPGMRLSRAVRAASGSILITAGFILGQRAINRLRDLEDLGDLILCEEFHIDIETVPQSLRALYSQRQLLPPSEPEQTSEQTPDQASG